MMTRRSVCLTASALAVGLNVPQAFAQSVAGKPLLTIGGQVVSNSPAGTVVFDREALEGLGLVTIETMTPWYATKVKFEGVPMATLMKAVGAKGQKLLVSALNDYTTEIPMEDFEKFNVVLAMKRDGQYMAVSDKGPLFIVYPFDANPELKTQKYYGRSAWQVARMTVS